MCIKQQNHNTSQQLQLPRPTDHRKYKNHALTTLHQISQSPQLDLITGPSSTHLQITLTILQVTQTKMRTIQKSSTKGRAELATLTTASATCTSLHQNAITTHYNCHRCGYSHQQNNCPATGQRCHKCNGIGHFAALCRTCYTNSHRYNTRRPSNRKHSSRSLSRSSSRSPTRSTSHHRHTKRHRSPTPHHINTITIA